MKLVSKIRKSVPSLNGSILVFLPNQVMDVEDFDVPACLDRGIVPANKVEAVADALDRQQEIINAVNTILDEGDETRITAAGVPKMKALEAILGYGITAQERDDAIAFTSGD